MLFSGASAPSATGDQTFLGDTWIREGSAWRKAAETGPRGRYAHGMVYDRARARTVLYGGAPDGNDDTWEWDGTRCTRVAPSRQPGGA